MRSVSFALHVLLVLTLLASGGCEGENAMGLGIPAQSVSPGRVGGVVLSAEGGVSGVTVVLAGRDSSMTDSQGEYFFDRLSPGFYQVVLRLPPGYQLESGQTLARNANVGSSRTTRIEWHLVGLPATVR